ncbi:uncharacterized protein LOC128660489 [Bombina bombina]|uniref:uncharacterized protein LOC128660489 n=1 Tax=Bombina bombina TaxID=8345 RepID=UPI00235AA3BB|nr:uncharacterized protein LOC128660489 [Bombina bombina]
MHQSDAKMEDLNTCEQSDAKNKGLYACEFCKVNCPSELSLFSHKLGQKHRNHCYYLALEMSKDPNSVANKYEESLKYEAEAPEGKKLQSYIDTFQNEPFLGLEYITEDFQLNRYNYECTLCPCAASTPAMILHIMGFQHKRMYLSKHHPDILVTGGKNVKKNLNVLARDLEKLIGRNKIKELTDKELKEKMNENVQKESTSSVNTDPANNEIKSLPSETEPKENVALEFKGNEDFIKYVKSFEIKTDEDASFIFKITQNLTKALLNYQKECSKKVSSTPSDSTVEQSISSTEQKTASAPPSCDPQQDVPLLTKPDDKPEVVEAKDKQIKNINTSQGAQNVETGGPEVKANTDVSAPAPSTGSENPHQELPLEGKPVTVSASDSNPLEVFFNSVKDMEAPQVAAIFTKVVATNPSLKGIDVESVMKYLKDTGKIKRS